MEKTSFNLKNFIGNCKTLLPNYFLSLNELKNSKQDIILTKKIIISFLKEYFSYNDTKFNQSQFNVKFINKFILELIPTSYPELSSVPLLKIQSIIANFINYLSLQKVLDRHVQKEIMKLFNNLNQQDKELDKIVKKGNLIEISNKIFDWSLNLNEILSNENECNQVYSYFEKKPKKVIAESIIELLKTVDDSDFLKVLVFIDTFLRIEILPSKVIEILEKHSIQDNFFFRLLMLYNTFFLAGYILKKNFSELKQDLKVKEKSFYEYVANVISYLDEKLLSNFIQDGNFQEGTDEFLDSERYINEIVPFNKETPYANTNDYKGFNLPEDINLELCRHITFLKNISNSFHAKMNFINSSWNEFEDYFSDTQERKIIKEARECYYDGKFKRALVLTNQLIKKNPESAVALYLKGKILGEQGAYYNALKCHLKSLKIDPNKIETYMDVSFLLEIGGYFHSSIILTSLLLQFCPFDINLHVQLAICSYQLSLPFKEPLKLAGLIDGERLINFLTRYWVHERIKSRDSFKKIEIGQKEFNELFRSSEIIVLNALKVMKLYGYKINDESFLNHLNKLLRNSLHFFPNKEDHIMKNWFVYELTIRLAENFYAMFYENYYILPYLIASEDFLNLCFEIAKYTRDQILYTQKERKNQTSFEIDTEIILENEKLYANNIYNFARFFISFEGISNILMKTVFNLINECNTCPNRCLEKPFKWCEAFYFFGKVPKNLAKYSELICFVEYLNTDFKITLEDKGLREETLNEKCENVEIFLAFIINIIQDKDYDFISERIGNYINIENMIKFLRNYVNKNKIISNQSAMKQMFRSLKSFISFLNKDYGYFDKKTFSDLNKLLNSIDLLNKCGENNSL